MSEREKYNPAGDEELAKMKRDVLADDQSIFSGFGDEQSTVPAVIGGFMGLQNKDAYSIIERAIIDKHERNILVDMIRLAEHGIGGEVLDIPIPYIGRQVVNYLRMSPSIDGKGREQAVTALTSWVKALEAREAEEKKKRQGVAG